jgi:hypothetical protein
MHMKYLYGIHIIIFFVLSIPLINSCKKNSVPALKTGSVTDITPISASSGGEVTNDGGAMIISRGVCWGTSQNPTVDNFSNFASGSTGAYICTLKELTPNTLYFVRAYAKNSTGIGYGDEVAFTTLPPDPVSVTDADGNVYNVVRIGAQLWMKENLKTTKWPDGTIINLQTSDYSWATLSATAKAYCWYNNDPSNKDIYGALYTWAAAQGACPTGWHVPTKDEWLTLSNPAKVNSSQFGGCRSSTGAFAQKDTYGHWWTSTQIDAGNAWESVLNPSNGDKGTPSQYKFCGISVRCIKDN